MQPTSGSSKARLILLFPLISALRKRSTRPGAGWFAAVLLGCLVIAGCATPVGIERVGPEIAYQKQRPNVLTTGDRGEWSRIVLTQWSLAERFATDPEAAIATLQAKIADG